MKDKLKEKYLPEPYKHRFLDKLHNLCQGMLVQDYMTTFNDLTLSCEVQEDLTRLYLGFVQD